MSRYSLDRATHGGDHEVADNRADEYGFEGNWLRCMQAVVDEVDIADDFPAYFIREIARLATRCINR